MKIRGDEIIPYLMRKDYYTYIEDEFIGESSNFSHIYFYGKIGITGQPNLLFRDLKQINIIY